MYISGIESACLQEITCNFTDFLPVCLFVSSLQALAMTFVVLDCSVISACLFSDACKSFDSPPYWIKPNCSDRIFNNVLCYATDRCHSHIFNTLWKSNSYFCHCCSQHIFRNGLQNIAYSFSQVKHVSRFCTGNFFLCLPPEGGITVCQVWAVMRPFMKVWNE